MLVMNHTFHAVRLLWYHKWAVESYLPIFQSSPAKKDVCSQSGLGEMTSGMCAICGVFIITCPIPLMVATFSLLYKKRFYRQPKIQIQIQIQMKKYKSNSWSPHSPCSTRSTCTYSQAQVDIKAHQEECFLGIRSWHEGCKHLGATEPQKRRSYSTWPHMEASQG